MTLAERIQARRHPETDELLISDLIRHLEALSDAAQVTAIALVGHENPEHGLESCVFCWAEGTAREALSSFHQEFIASSGEAS